MSESEYLVLPANSSPKTYPDNANNSYKVKLPRRLTLQSGEWEIALRSVHYRDNWKTVTNGVITVVRQSPSGTNRSYECRVKSGRYYDPWSLLVEMRVALNGNQTTKGKVVLHYDETLDGLTMAFANGQWSASFSEELAHIWGLKSGEFYGSASGVKRSGVPADPFAGYEFMYVYCSLVRPRVVGHSLVPLLMEVPVETPGKLVKRVNVTPALPQYVPVENGDTDEIEIDIRRGDGEPFLFESGVVSVTVELRRRRA